MPHIHEKIDFTVEVLIVCKNRVLLRMHDKYHKWLSVGGHIELHEDPLEAALREVEEEVGLDVELYCSKELPPPTGEGKDIFPPEFVNRHRINATHEHISFTYFARSRTDKLHLSDTEVSAGCRWFSADELDEEDIDERIKFYARKALEELSE